MIEWREHESMGYAELVAKLQTLPVEKQAEVFDFVDFLAARFARGDEVADWTDAGFNRFSVARALDDQADDRVEYGVEDIKERWE